MKFESTDDMFRSCAARALGSADPHASAVRKVLILSTPRSGSTFFCDALERTGLMGHPLEYLNPRVLSEVCKAGRQTRFVGRRLFWFKSRLAGRRLLKVRPDQPSIESSRRAWVDISEYLKHLQSATSCGGVFSVHIHIPQWRILERKRLDPLAMGFDDILYVGRRSRLRQALSLAMSIKYDYWDSRVVDTRRAQAAVSRGEVLYALKLLDEWYSHYESRIAPHVAAEFYSEDFLADPAMIGDVPVMLGIASERVDIPPSDLRPTTAGTAEAQYREMCDWLGVAPGA